MLHSLPTYDLAVIKAREFQRQLDITCKMARTFITWRDGKTKKGYRVTVIRLRDGMTKSAFIKIKEK